MNLIDILTAKSTIVENDDDDFDVEDQAAKEGEIIRKVMTGLKKLFEALEDEDVIGEVLFQVGGGAQDPEQEEAVKLLSAVFAHYGVHMEQLKGPELVSLFKKLGLTRGEAEFVVDMSS